jgi:RNA polymerase sigma-70 factor (ECF subfamily)
MPEPPTHKDWVLAALDAHERPLLRFAATVVGPERARDVVQDAFLELCKADRASVETRLVPWLFTVTRNRALTLRRADRKRAEEEEAETMESTDTGPHGALESKETGTSVAAFVDELPPKHREVVALKFSGGLSYKEIAEVTGLSVSHVGVLLHEAIGRVRDRMKKRELATSSGRRTA